MDSKEFREVAKASIDHSTCLGCCEESSLHPSTPPPPPPLSFLSLPRVDPADGRKIVVDYYENITDHSVVSQVEPGYLRKLLPTAAPEDGEAWSAIRADIDSKIVPGLTHWQSPNFLAFFPCPASYPSVLGELYSAAFTGACFNWICSPAVTELETIVLDWLAQALGLPETYLSTGPTRGGGVIQGTASEAVLTMMVAARDKYLRETLPYDELDPESEEMEDLVMRKRSRMVALGSAACHSSTKKAAKILGVRYVAVPAGASSGFAMTGDALRATLAMCREKGWEPFFLTVALGTTDTCAVDDLGGVVEALAEFSKDFPLAAVATSPTASATTTTNGNGVTNGTTNGAATTNGTTTNGEAAEEKKAPLPVRKKGEVWVHVDAAYAGAALVTPEAQAALGTRTHLAHYHSFNVNMHKWLLTNFDASCVFVADRAPLEAAMSSELHVYRNAYSDGGLVTDYRNWQVPLGRRFRALKVWFVLRSYGVRGLRDYVRAGVARAEAFAAWMAARGDRFEVVAGPCYALTVFRVRGGGGAGEEDVAKGEAWTRRLHEEVNKTGRVWLTGTVLEGRFAIRVMTANRLTEEAHVRAAWELIEATADRIAKG